jgi:hypothetical protein
MSTTVETLKAARDLIKDRRHWCQHHYAMKDGKDTVVWDDPDADQFCALGAIHRATGVSVLDVCSPAVYDARLALKRALPPGFNSVQCLNDGKVSGPRWFRRLVAHHAVIQMYDRAIKAEET